MTISVNYKLIYNVLQFMEVLFAVSMISLDECGDHSLDRSIPALDGVGMGVIWGRRYPCYSIPLEDSPQILIVELLPVVGFEIIWSSPSKEN